MTLPTCDESVFRTKAYFAFNKVLSAAPDPAGSEFTERFERRLAAKFDVAHAVALASGTAAVHTALAALGIGPGDEVLVTGATVVMTIVAILETGARPILVDTLPDSFEIDIEDAAAKVTGRTRAIVPVHLAGRCGNLAAIARFAADHGLHLVEDACQAQGSQYRGRAAGTWGKAGCFSLKDGKIAWSGEGGYLLTDDAHLAAAARAFRTHGQAPGASPRIGRNYRITEIQAAIAAANIARFDQLLARRRAQSRLLTDALADCPGIGPLPEASDGLSNGYSPLLQLTLPRPRAFARHLSELGVLNSVGTFGLTSADQLPTLAGQGLAPCPNAARVIDKTLAPVIGQHDEESDLLRYAETITKEATAWLRA